MVFIFKHISHLKLKYIYIYHNQAMAQQSNGAVASQKILNVVNEISAMIKEDREANKVSNGETIALLNEILTKISATKSSTRGSSSKNSSTPTSDKKFPTNSMYWFKNEWKTNREATMDNYLTADSKKALNDHMTTDDIAKSKIGTAKLEEEAKFIWNGYVKPEKCSSLRDRIKSDYEKAHNAWKKENMTPASKDTGNNEGADE
jgi:hypothetical protein